MASAALSSVDALRLVSSPSHKEKRGSSRSSASSSLITNGMPLHRILPSPLRAPVGLAIKAIGSEGRDNLDYLKRASNAKMPQQAPKRREAQSAPIGLWDRFPTARTVQQMMETMERMMEDPFAYSSVSLPSVGGSEENGVSYRRGRTPWEIKEGEGEYKMRFDMPGMTRRDVKVWVEERMLVVKAKKLPKEGKEGKEGEEEEEEWSPKSYGRYDMRIALPDNVDVEKIKAEVKDGVLYIAIPKVSSSSRVLDIEVQ